MLRNRRWGVLEKGLRWANTRQSKQSGPPRNAGEVSCPGSWAGNTLSHIPLPFPAPPGGRDTEGGITLCSYSQNTSIKLCWLHFWTSLLLDFMSYSFPSRSALLALSPGHCLGLSLSLINSGSYNSGPCCDTSFPVLGMCGCVCVCLTGVDWKQQLWSGLWSGADSMICKASWHNTMIFATNCWMAAEFPRVILILIYVTIGGSGAFRLQHSAEAKSSSRGEEDDSWHVVPVRSLFYYSSNIITWEKTFIIDCSLHWASSHKSEKEEEVLRHSVVDKVHYYSLIRWAANSQINVWEIPCFLP